VLPARSRRWPRCYPGRATGRATGRGAHAEDLAESSVEHLELVERDGDAHERALGRAAAGGDAQGRVGACRFEGSERPDERPQARAPARRETAERADRRSAARGRTPYLVGGGQRERHEGHPPVSLDVDGQSLERGGARGDGLERDHAQAEVALEEALGADEVAGKVAGHLPALPGGAGGQAAQPALEEVVHAAVAAVAPQAAFLDGGELPAVVVGAGVVAGGAVLDALDAFAQALGEVRRRRREGLGRGRCRVGGCHGSFSWLRRAVGPGRAEESEQDACRTELV
jgi:hypothetical protein